MIFIDDIKEFISPIIPFEIPEPIFTILIFMVSFYIMFRVVRFITGFGLEFGTGLGRTRTYTLDEADEIMKQPRKPKGYSLSQKILLFLGLAKIKQ